MMTRRYLFALALPLVIAGCKPEEGGQSQPFAKEAAGDTPVHNVARVVTGNASADELQLSTKVNPRTGKCLGPDVYIFSSGDQFEWVDLKEIRKHSGGGPMIRGDFTFEENTLHVTNARVTDILGQTQNQLPDKDLVFAKVSAPEGDAVFLNDKRVYTCLLTLGDVFK